MSSERKETVAVPQIGSCYPYYLGNKPVQANEDLIVLNKYTNKEITKCALANAEVIDEAIGLAVKAAPAMAALKAFERKAILNQIVKEIEERFEELANALCLEAGKPIKDARGEVQRCIDTFVIAAEETVRLYGQYIPLDISAGGSGYQSIVKRFPVGPISMISPFNFPLNLVAHKVAPAIAVGCPFVLKPASRTPIGAILLGEIMSKTALPEGAFSILPCSREGADLFTTDERFKVVSFTGSPAVGWAIKSRAGKKKVVLELGGNAACIIDEGTDIADAVNRVTIGAFYQSGQSCIGVQRILIHESLYDEFITAFCKHVATLKTGDPRDPETFIGPMISPKDALRCEIWVTEAVEAGAKVLVGGTRHDDVFYDATVVENVPKGLKLDCEEVFGPVCTVKKFTDFKKAIEEVNDSRFGLQAGVFTKDFNKSFYAFENLDVGGVVINDVPSKRIDSMPYGGVKDSGLGREGIRWAIQDFTEERLLLMRNAGNL